MSWVDIVYVAELIGPAVNAEDVALEHAVDAANAWAPRKRAQAGYTDDPDIAPDAAVRLGTGLYAVALYRERASTDSYTSFEELSTFAPTGTMGQIRRLLGIGRAAVDAPPVEAVPLQRRLFR